MSIQDVGQRIKGMLPASILRRERVVYERIGILTVLVVVGLSSFMIGRLSAEGGVSDPLVMTWVERSVTGESASVMASTEASPQAHRKAESVTGISNEAVASTSQNEAVVVPASGAYVASRKGTKYHLPWCSGAKTISEENKIWFETKDEAEAAGYTPAKNCKGL